MQHPVPPFSCPQRPFIDESKKFMRSESERQESTVALTIDDVTDISREIAHRCDPRLELLGVASADAESERVELLLTIHDYQRDPCVFMFNVTRSDQMQL